MQLQKSGWSTPQTGAQAWCQNADLAIWIAALGPVARKTIVCRYTSDILQNGESITDELEKNADKLRAINNKVTEIESQISRAGKAVNVLRRRLMTDKLFWVFLFLVVAAIAGILIYVAINPDQSNFAVPKEAVPPTPEQVKEDAKAARASDGGRLLRVDREVEVNRGGSKFRFGN